MSLTIHQLNCLKVIDRLTKDGVSPSIREIGMALNSPSQGRTQDMVLALIARGFLTKVDRAARSLEITPKGRALLIGSMDLSKLSNIQIKQLARDLQAEIRRRTPRAAA